MKSSKYITKQNLVKFLFESVLIVFSVLFALFLNEYRGNLKENELKQQALEKVYNEIETNLKTVNEWLPYHEKVFNNLQRAFESDSIKSALRKKKEISFWDLMPAGVTQSVINNAAWQAFKSSNVFSNVDFDTLLSLSKVYNIQKTGVETTIQSISETLMSRITFKKEELEISLLVLKNHFGELTAQERLLIKTYESCLKNLRITDNIE